MEKSKNGDHDGDDITSIFSYTLHKIDNIYRNDFWHLSEHLTRNTKRLQVNQLFATVAYIERVKRMQIEIASHLNRLEWTCI